jgi:hypothetical protein
VHSLLLLLLLFLLLRLLLQLLLLFLPHLLFLLLLPVLALLVLVRARIYTIQVPYTQASPRLPSAFGTANRQAWIETERPPYRRHFAS